MKVTRFEDAKAMRRMGMPLNTPVKERTLSKQYTRLWCRYMNACYAFAKAVLNHCEKCSKKSLGQVGAAFIELAKINNRCVELSDNPKWDEGERALLLSLHQQNLWPFIEEFGPALEAIEQLGESFACPPIKDWSIWWAGALEK
jgi:hypothetical protein